MKQFKDDTDSKPSGREAVGSIFAERHSNKKNVKTVRGNPSDGVIRYYHFICCEVWLANFGLQELMYNYCLP